MQLPSPLPLNESQAQPPNNAQKYTQPARRRPNEPGQDTRFGFRMGLTERAKEEKDESGSSQNSRERVEPRLSRRSIPPVSAVCAEQQRVQFEIQEAAGGEKSQNPDDGECVDVGEEVVGVGQGKR